MRALIAVLFALTLTLGTAWLEKRDARRYAYRTDNPKIGIIATDQSQKADL